MTIAYIRQILIFIIVLIPFYAIVRYLWIWSASFGDRPRETSVIRWLIQEKKYPRELAQALFILFTAGLLYLALQGTYTDPVQMLSNAVTRIKNNDGISLAPFRSIYRYFSHFELDIFLVNIGGNVLMFIPWGIGLTMLYKKNHSFPWIVTLCFALPVFIETSQLFIGRQVDIDDWILNTAGGLLGVWIYRLFRRHFPKLEQFET